MLPPAFEVIEPDPGRVGRIPLVAHIPHSSSLVPAADRARILLDDRALDRELVRMTDWHTDQLFGWVPERGGTALVHRRSRLVVDPERFDDVTLEPMEAIGQGAVYTRASDGVPLRDLRPGERETVIETLFQPYHRALSGLVATCLSESRRCIILDCHSFGTIPLPSEWDQAPDRPDICIGTDAFHTPPALAGALEAAFVAEGFRVERDSPFGGALVPLDRYRTDLRVASVMVEVRRGLYCDETTGAPLSAFADVRSAIERACAAAGVLDAG